VADDLLPDSDLHAIAACRGTDAQEVMRLVHKAWDYWKMKAGPKESSHIETPFRHVGALGGTTDIRWREAYDWNLRLKRAHVLDWKFGYEQRDVYHQLAQYAFDYRGELRLEGWWDSSATIETEMVWVRLGKVERHVFDNTELDAWYAYALKREALAGEVYNPGDHCGFCDHAPACLARAQWQREAVNALVVADSLAMATPEALGALRDRAKAVKRALDAYDKAVNAVLDAGEDIPLPNGKVMRRAIREGEAIDARKALPLLRAAGFTPDDMEGILDIKKGAVEEIVKARTPPRINGGKKAAWDNFMSDLREKKALVPTYTKIKEEVTPNGQG
jgi:hypothetical protein